MTAIPPEAITAHVSGEQVNVAATTRQPRVWFGEAAEAYAEGKRDGAAAERARMNACCRECCQGCTDDGYCCHHRETFLRADERARIREFAIDGKHAHCEHLADLLGEPT